MTITDLDQAHAALAAFNTRALNRENYTLDRMRRLLADLDDPQEEYPCVHIAGTSGKTSVAYYVAGLLRSAGATVGLTVSPFVESITERVQIGGSPSEAAFVDQLDDFLATMPRTAVQPSYFEVLVAFAFHVFRLEQVDYGVIETGVGGLLDGTNVISRPDKIAVITDIGLDHTDLLGDTVEEIAVQKAGIVQPGNLVLVQGGQDRRVMSTLRHEALARGAAEVEVIGESVGPARGHRALAPFQRRNWRLASAAAERVIARDSRLTPVDLQSISPLDYGPPGRLEVLPLGDRRAILDGAHNPQKLSALKDALVDGEVGPIRVLLAMGRFSEAKTTACLEVIATFASTVTVTEYSVGSAAGRESWPAHDLAELADRCGIEVASTNANSRRALAEVLAAEEDLLITGSLYLVAELRAALVARSEQSADPKAQLHNRLEAFTRTRKVP